MMAAWSANIMQEKQVVFGRIGDSGLMVLFLGKQLLLKE